MLHFLFPLGLLALASLLIPVAIHLFRPPVRTVKLGSLRFLQSPYRRRWQDSQWRQVALLLLRLGILASLALMLARPEWIGRMGLTTKKWALLSPDANLEGESLLEWKRLTTNGFEAREFAPGFGRISGKRPEPVDMWSLMRELEMRNAESVVFAPARQISLRGERPALRRVRLVPTPLVEIPPPKRSAAPEKPIKVAIVGDSPPVRAAIEAVRQVSPRKIDVVSEVSEPGDWIFQIAGTAPAWIAPAVEEKGANLLVSTNSLPNGTWSGDWLNPSVTRIRQGRGMVWQIDEEFDPEWMATTAFPDWIRSLLLPPPPVLPEADRRWVDPSQAAPSERVSVSEAPLDPTPDRSASLGSLAWILAAVLFLAERLLAHVPPRQREASA